MTAFLTYTTAQAKREFSIGYLTDFHIQRYPMTNNWIVQLKGGGNGYGFLVDARKKEPRQFKTLDAVVAALEDVGFKVEGFLRG